MKIITGSTGTTHITSDDDRQFNMAVWGEGDYVLPNGRKLAATLVDNNTINIADGDICMQGCHARINANTTEALNIGTGAVGKKRIDLIVARYVLNSDTGFENVSLEVVKGTETTGTPAEPPINNGTSLRDGATIHDMLLYRVDIDGINVAAVTPKYATASYIWESLAKLCETTVTAGQTNVTIEDARINENSLVDGFYAWNKELSGVQNISVSNGSISFEIEAQDSETRIGVRIL